MARANVERYSAAGASEQSQVYSCEARLLYQNAGGAVNGMAARGMWDDVRTFVGPGVASACAAAALGAGMASAGRLVGVIWGGAPLPLLLAASLVFTVAGLLPRRAGGLALVGVGIGVTAASLAAPALVAPGPNLEIVSRIVPWTVGIGMGLTLAPAALGLGRFSAPSAVAALLGWAVATTAPMVVAVGLMAVGATLAARCEPALANLGLRRHVIRLLPTLVSGAVAAVAAAAFFGVRPVLGPTPNSWLMLGGGAFLAGALPRSRVLACALVAAAVASVVSAVTGGGFSASSAVFVLIGAAPVGVARAVGVTLPGFVLPAVAVLAALPLLRSLPPAWQAVGASTGVGLPAERAMQDRIVALRSGAPIRTSWGWWGSSQVWGGASVSLVELDGSVAGSSGRSRAAERLAGTLAGCVVGGKERVRVVGDDFGRAVVSLREQGFSGIDVAMPDAALADTLASADDGARRAWLSTEVRLLAVPARGLLGARGNADAIVEIVRNGWRDGRSAWPSEAHLRAGAAHVGKDGAHVLVLPGVGVDQAALAGAVRHFGDVWPVVAIFVPPQGAEQLVLVGTEAAIPWSRLEHCIGSATWLRAEGVTTALELASLAVGDHHLARALDSQADPGDGMPVDRELLPISRLLAEATESEHVFGGSVPDALAARQATRRASLSVLLAGASGDVRAALERAQAMADQPGAGTAIDPMIAPMLDRARSAATAARAEGPDSPKWDAADAAIEAALLMNPASATARCLRGDIAMVRRRVDEASRWYRECSERDPESAAPWEGLARARLILGDRAGAEEAFRAAARLAPNSWQAALNLGVFLRGAGEMEEAETWLRRAEDGASTRPEVGRSRPHLALAMLYLETHRPELALAEARRAEVDESSPDSAYWVAAAQYDLELWPEAEAGFRLAMKRREGFVEAENGLGLCLARRNDYTGAAAAFRDALSRDPKNAVAREKLDLLRQYLGDEKREPPAPAPPVP